MHPLPDMDTQIKRALTFMTHIEPTSRYRRENGRSSYLLKHMAEQYVGTYVSDDALVAAAQMLDFPMRADGLGTRISVTERSLKTLIRPTTRPTTRVVGKI